MDSGGSLNLQTSTEVKSLHCSSVQLSSSYSSQFHIRVAFKCKVILGHVYWSLCVLLYVVLCSCAHDLQCGYLQITKYLIFKLSYAMKKTCTLAKQNKCNSVAVFSKKQQIMHHSSKFFLPNEIQLEPNQVTTQISDSV